MELSNRAAVPVPEERPGVSLVCEGREFRVSPLSPVVEPERDGLDAVAIADERLESRVPAEGETSRRAVLADDKTGSVLVVDSDGVGEEPGRGDGVYPEL